MNKTQTQAYLSLELSIYKNHTFNYPRFELQLHIRLYVRHEVKVIHILNANNTKQTFHRRMKISKKKRKLVDKSEKFFEL